MKSLFIAAIIGVVFIAGCNTNDNTMTERDQIVDELDPSNNYEEPSGDNTNSKIGYVRYTKEQFDNDTVNRNKTFSIDRNEMADMITRIILQNNGFNEVATLVTDQEVLIAYDRNEETSEGAAADIAKRTAMSIMPSYFEIHVSDNETIMHDIQSLHNSTTENRDYDNTINLIIKEMQKSSHGNDNQEMKN
jgi:hypothetical protein